MVMAFLASDRLESAVIYVQPSGADAQAGTSWPTAKRTVTAALTAAHPGDEIWVAAGTYFERISLRKDVALYGGFAGGETQRDQRDFARHRAILDGAGGGTVVRCELVGIEPNTRLDGFVVRNGLGVMGGGIACVASAPTIANCEIRDNVSAGPGGGINCYNGADPVIAHNLIVNNRASGDEADGGGIACMKGATRSNLGSSPLILGNIIARNIAEENGGGIAASGVFVSEDGLTVVPSAPVILNNFIVANLATEPPLGERSVGGGAIACIEDGMARLIANNTIAANAGFQAGGILLLGGARDDPIVVNNTLVGNCGPALRWSGVHSIRIVNNLVAYNTAGLTRWIESPGTPNPVIAHNLIHGNAVDYDGLPNPIGSQGNLGFAPRLAGHAYGDFHLQPDSPAVNAGDGALVEADWVDMDGGARFQGGQVDIGSDESDGLGRVALRRVLRVSPAGNDNLDGQSWDQAKRTVAAAIAAIHDRNFGPGHTVIGGEVWVRSGAYAENLTLPPFVYLRGGFVGQETEPDQRPTDGQLTTLDGAGRGRVILAWGGHALNAVDRFHLTGGRITGGLADQGAGLECYQSGTLVTDCRIQSNVGNLGGGVGVFAASPVISRCTDHQQPGRQRRPGRGRGDSRRPILRRDRPLRDRAQHRRGWRRGLRLVQPAQDREQRDLRQRRQRDFAGQQSRPGLGLNQPVAGGQQPDPPKPHFPSGRRTLGSPLLRTNYQQPRAAQSQRDIDRRRRGRWSVLERWSRRRTGPGRGP